VADEPVSMIRRLTARIDPRHHHRLNKDEGISFLCITHDLSTAYHIADELVVLLEGETVERGPACTVIDTPQHEYAKLLVDSVPVPESRRALGEAYRKPRSQAVRRLSGCLRALVGALQPFDQLGLEICTDAFHSTFTS
jgi:ABC-type glutathione transport system ATPase component